MGVSASSPSSSLLGAGEGVFSGEILLVSIKHLEIGGNEGVAVLIRRAVNEGLDNFLNVVKKNLHQGPVNARGE